MTALRAILLAVVCGLGVGGLAAQAEQDNNQVAVDAPPSTPLPERDFGAAFIAANTAYEQGDYAAAITGYRELLERGASSGHLHFNLGNAYLRHGELGRAIAEFRRARRLLPRNEDIQANLSFARESARDAIAPPEPSPVLAALLFWYFRLSRIELATLAVGLSVLFWGLAVVWIWRRESEILRWTLLGLWLALLGTLGSLVGQTFFAQPVAVVVPQEIDAFTAPDVDSVVRFKLHAGTELRIRDERQQWLRISLPDEQQGWIESQWAAVVDD